MLWYVPHRQELARLYAYYLHSQLMPHSWAQFVGNLRVSVFSWSRGLVPYLIKHTGIVFGLAVWQCVVIVWKREERDPIEGFLVWWFALFVVLFCCVNYAPSRYFVLFYPSMAVLASMALTALTPDPSPNLGRGETIPKMSSSPQNWGFRGALLIWALLNGYWMIDWGEHLQYRQVEVGRDWRRCCLQRVGCLVLSRLRCALRADCIR